MAAEKKYVVKTAVHHASKGVPAKGELGDPGYVPAKPGKMVKLEAGQICPPELVEELKGLGVLSVRGSDEKEPNFGKGVEVGEPGEVGKYEELPSRDNEDDEDKKKPGYAKAKKGK